MNLYKITFYINEDEHYCYIKAKNVLEAICKADDISIEYPYYICLVEEDI